MFTCDYCSLQHYAIIPIRYLLHKITQAELLKQKSID